MDEGVLLKLVSFGDELVKGEAAPYFLAETLGYEFCDLAEDDICNQQIFRSVLNYIIDAKDIFVLIGWTHSKRMEMDWKGKKFTYRPDEKDYVDNGLNGLHRYDHVLFDDLLIGQHWASEVYTLQQSLEFHKIKYYMYNTQDKIYFHQKTMRNLKALNNRQYHNPINLQSSMLHFLKKEGYEHINQEAHKRWSDFLHDKIVAGAL